MTKDSGSKLTGGLPFGSRLAAFGSWGVVAVSMLAAVVASCAGAVARSTEVAGSLPPSLTELNVLPKALEACQLSELRVVGPDPVVQFGAEVTASQDLTRSLMAWCRIYGPIGNANAPSLELEFETQGAFFGMITTRLIGPTGADAYTFSYADLIERHPFDPATGFHASDFLFSAAEQLVFLARRADGRTRRLMSYRDITGVACSPQWRASVPMGAMIPRREGRRLIMIGSSASRALAEDAITTQFVLIPTDFSPERIEGGESTSLEVRPYWIGPFTDSRRPYRDGRLALVPIAGTSLVSRGRCPAYTVTTTTDGLSADEARIAEALARRFSSMSDIAPLLGHPVPQEFRGDEWNTCRTIVFGGGTNVDAGYDTAFYGVGGELRSDERGRDTSLIIGGSMLRRRDEPQAEVDAVVSYGGSITGAGGFRCQTRILN